MKISELESDDFGVKTPSIEEIAKKHGVSVYHLQNELRQGIRVEYEHTKDTDLSSEIARDHLNEDPDYYTKLKAIHKD